ncbi:hypothetical protein ACTQ49_08285 [Luteococcus sp. Sow4_B9]|uniref:hypothetical protein n=1 Tax=Luteococcus sp. Sow4_B9 TaxID=3438792 RepID=UPI003F9A7CB8
MTTSPNPAISPKKALSILTCALLAVGSFAGCTKDDEKADGATDKSAAAVPTVTAPPLPKEPTFKGDPVGAVADVKIVDCPTEKGEQTAKIALTNSTKKARDYAVMVIWLKNDSGTPLGSGLVTSKAAAPGKKVDLTVKAKVVDKADRCVLNVKAGTLK